MTTNRFPATDPHPLPSSHSDSLTRLSGKRARFIRAAWLIVFALALCGFCLSESSRFARPNTIPAETYAAIEASGLPRLTPILVFVAVDVIFMAIFTGVALILFVRRGHDWVALAVGIMLVTTGYLYSGIRFLEIPALKIILAVLNAIAETGQVSFLFIFPDGRVLPRWWRYAVVPFFLFRVIVWQIELWLNQPQFAWEIGIVVGLLLVGLGYQRYRYLHLSTLLQRQQIKLLVLGACFTVLAVAPTVFLLSVFRLVTSSNNFGLYTLLLVFRQIALSVVPLALGFSILRYRLWDIDLTINRSIVYGAVAMILGVLFLVGFLILQALFDRILSGATTAAIAISGVAVGLLFNPTRRRVQNVVDRRFYRFRFNLFELRRANQVIIFNPTATSGQHIGKYEILDVLGKGGMGEVYRGQSSNRIVAIKILPLALTASIGGKEARRFDREAKALLSLDHPNIVHLYEANTEHVPPYLAIEYIDGIDLAAYLKQHGMMPLAEACRILETVAMALDHCHRLGIIHRDIKPSNIMLRLVAGGSRLEPVLMDFGLAKLPGALSTLTGTGAVGTIDYMAPEQIREAREVDHRADIYAIGVMAYEVFTGQRVFIGQPSQVMFAHLSQPAPDPRKVRPDLPAPLALAVLRALQKEPDERYQHASDFAAEFRVTSYSDAG